MIFESACIKTMYANGFRHTLACTLIISAFLASACSSQKVTQASPELPPKYWIAESLDADSIAKPKTEIPSLYNSTKVFSFTDCVYLTIQQSPLLVNSAIEIDSSKLKLIDAVWQYVPEPKMRIGISPNLTQRNHDSELKPHNYGDVDFEVGFYATLNNPVMSYYNHNIQEISVDIAIAAHRQVIGETIRKIAAMYLEVEAQYKIEQAHKKIIDIRKNTTAYWNKLEAIDGQQGTKLEIAIQSEHEAQLIHKKSLMITNILKTDLKVIAGVNTQNPFEINASKSENIVADFDGYALNWEDRWDYSERSLILKKQVKLHDYNITISWAQYIPDMRIALDQSPPAGQYTPSDGKDDLFAHIYLDFPLIDWGRRYRGVQSARTSKAAAFNKQIRERTNYSTQWVQIEQRYSLDKTSEEIARTALNIEKLKNKEVQILFNNGNVQLPELMQSEYALAMAEINHINKELEVNRIKLDWMLHSSSLQEPFIGQAQKEI